jgi:hypothetical protein
MFKLASRSKNAANSGAARLNLEPESVNISTAI